MKVCLGWLVKLNINFKEHGKNLVVVLFWSLTLVSVITPRIYSRIEYALGHGMSDPYMVPILDWPQYVVLSFSTLLMGVLIGDFTAFLLFYIFGIILSSALIYVLILLPIYLNILPSVYFDYYDFAALNYITKSLIIAPIVLFLFIGVIGVFLREFILED